MTPTVKAAPEREQRRRVRRTALLCGLIALAFYATFIVFSILQARR
jgi:hypothetical protein